MKAGTRISTKGSPSIGGMPQVAPETAVICPWNRRISGEPMRGWHVVKFDSDKAVLLMHEENFTVINP